MKIFTLPSFISSQQWFIYILYNIPKIKNSIVTRAKFLAFLPPGHKKNRAKYSFHESVYKFVKGKYYYGIDDIMVKRFRRFLSLVNSLAPKINYADPDCYFWASGSRSGQWLLKYQDPDSKHCWRLSIFSSQVYFL